MFFYSDLINKINNLNNSIFHIGSIGRTVLGQEIPYIRIGNNELKNIIISGGIHAREHITSFLLFNMAVEYSLNINDNWSIYFLPMLNPDGIRLSTEGIGFLDNFNSEYKEYIKKINGKEDLRLWKANINGVDLNVNFDAGWGTGKKNVFYPCSQNYVGEKPNDQPETNAIIKFTKKIQPYAVLAYHCKGEVIYWNYKQYGKQLWRDYILARKISRITGYSLIDANSSAGGYKDWCIEKLKIPALTIEVVSDKYSHPVPYSVLPILLDQNRHIIRELLAFLDNDILCKKEN